jgi:cytochrome c biogenesis protein CcdA
MPDEIISANNHNDTPNHRPELSAEPINKRPIIIGGAVALAIVIIFGGIGWLLFIYPETTGTVRDIFIIYMGLGIFIIILLLIALIVMAAYLVLKINDLVQLLDREIKPMLAKVQEALNTVRGTTTFLSDHAVQPVITTVSTVSGVKAIFRSLFRR